MSPADLSPGLRAARLPKPVLDQAFADLHPAYSAHEARVAADRCYFCHDAPCVTACPTAIDVPLFIRQIATGATLAAARTILDQNILGGMCARVCPTETLCEQACVRNAAEGAPVTIGRLQRFATDAQMATGAQPYARAPLSGHSIAVVGAGPAGLAAAHRLAMLGHDVTLFDARPKPGGLNEYGIAAYKTPQEFAAREVQWLLQIGGITWQPNTRLGRDITLAELQGDHDAVLLALGLGQAQPLAGASGGAGAATAAIDWIADLRQAPDFAEVPVGRHVVVVGGGMTAIDAAVQSKLLGAESVTIVYRRSRAEMGASRYEQDLATAKGVTIRTNALPLAVERGGVTCGYTDADLRPTGETFHLPADQVLAAIGQRLDFAPDLALTGGRIAVSGAGRTSIPGVWAAGDCVALGDDLTVTAVAQGRDAAMDIHAALTPGA